MSTEPDVALASIIDCFRPLFAPESIAVAGASTQGTSAGNRFIRSLKTAGYGGRIYAVHPNAEVIDGIPAFGRIADIPGVVDYAYLTVPAERVESILAATGGKLRFAQVMATNEDGSSEAWEKTLLTLAREMGTRLIGPNCMGSHSPRGGYTFVEGASLSRGRIGIACQSGGLGMDILLRGQNLGLSYSGLVTLGNSIDVEPSDLFEYYLADPGTEVIGMYVEDIKDGRRFLDLARRNRGSKPVVLMVGGLSKAGQKAAVSHTGAMGGGRQAWEALARQTGAILAPNLDAFLDALQVCSLLRPKLEADEPTVTLLGNGGGTSVLATDALDAAGFKLAELQSQAREAYAEIDMPPGASLKNPMDVPASVLKEEEGRLIARLLEVDRRFTSPYATLVHLNLPVLMAYRHVKDLLPNLVQSMLSRVPKNDKSPHTLLILRSDRSDEADDWRRRMRTVALQHRIPTFDELPQAIMALQAYRKYERFLATRSSG
ncbi:CoA-binding protein [Bradyrhizobium mercantei]|uniref:CoA-binding protein n=1 Tax=Bradyrhizobium mercantei TaxID=1904807 RepID=UPI0009776C76|nr:CoA-binding protein [Bradyrhizobium mercantei]